MGLSDLFIDPADLPDSAYLLLYCEGGSSFFCFAYKYLVTFTIDQKDTGKSN